MARQWHEILSEHQQVIQALEPARDVVERIITAVTACLRASHRVYLLGNGGSAADAQHIAAELLGRFKTDRIALPALALTTDSSTLTAIGNDLGYENVFSRQLEGLLQAGDLVWILSTSGNSPNVVKAAQTAQDFGVAVIGFTGQGGGKLRSHCDLLFEVPHASSDRIQEAHLIAYHYICERVEAALG
jgi:D-sedoheptulose 7-phosphate isomerase